MCGHPSVAIQAWPSKCGHPSVAIQASFAGHLSPLLGPPGLKRLQEINVAFGGMEIAARRRAEEVQPPHAVFSAKFGNLPAIFFHNLNHYDYCNRFRCAAAKNFSRGGVFFCM